MAKRFKFKVEDRVQLDCPESIVVGGVGGTSVKLNKGTVASRDNNVAGNVYMVKFDGVDLPVGPYREVDLNRTV